MEKQKLVLTFKQAGKETVYELSKTESLNKQCHFTTRGLNTYVTCYEAEETLLSCIFHSMFINFYTLQMPSRSPPPLPCQKNRFIHT